MKHVVEEQRLMAEEQNGFRRDKHDEDNLFDVSEIIERKRKENKKVYLAFLNIENTYDRVDCRGLQDVLRKIGFSVKIVNIVKSLHEDICAVYRLGDLVTGQMRSVRGVRQGCTLSPLLFGLYTEELAVCLRMNGFELKVGEEKLSCLLYADDIVVVSESEPELQRMLEIVDGYSRDVKGGPGGVSLDDPGSRGGTLGCHPVVRLCGGGNRRPLKKRQPNAGPQV
ncbi:Reverse transcriptase domain [Trinorchestia longiramus]|nr:Reverse transcriptase domain [Trinorchestia longiramus]